MVNNVNKYFESVQGEVERTYKVALLAKEKGLDPSAKVEVHLARNLAERVIGLVSSMYPQVEDERIAKRIVELEQEYGMLDFAVAFKIAEEIAKEKFCKFQNLKEAIDAAIRIGFSYFTVGVVSSPLEGFTHWETKKTRDGEDYMCMYYSGPIRSAGGTNGSVSIMLGDYLREVFGFARYDPTEDEVKRTVHEIHFYHERITNLQYVPSEKELEFVASKIPVQIDGLPSEDKEVYGYKNLKRVETNFVRNGVALILGEGICQKAHKLVRILNKLRAKGFKLESWSWLEELAELKNKEQAKTKESASSATYISDLVAGRPVIGHPGKSGGLRLRYGRARTSGLSSMAMHPLSMEVLKGYIAMGTQLKYEGPGKSSAMSLCDEIDCPIIKLENGEVVRIDTKEKAEMYKKRIGEVLYLGDLLVNYAEFFNRGKHLEKPGYCQEWYNAELKKKIEEFKDKEANEKDAFNLARRVVSDWKARVGFEEALLLSGMFKISLHPNFIYYWKEIDYNQFLSLLDWISHARVSEGKLLFPYTHIDKERFVKGKRALELLGVEHTIGTENVVLNEENTKALLFNLGIESFENLDDKINEISKKIREKEALEVVNGLCKFKIKNKSGTFIGARMGRPEKAKLRKLTGSPHVLFPVGEEGGRLRSFQAALEKGYVKSEFPNYYCNKCKKEGIYGRCLTCGKSCKKLLHCPRCGVSGMSACEEHGIGNEYSQKRLEVRELFEDARKRLGLNNGDLPVIIKGVRGTSSKDHSCENLSKGILRAKYNLNVNKDGTIRYDVTEMPLTHFKPFEVGTSVEKLIELGYYEDYQGKKLENDNQLVELFPQDVILPACPQSPDEKADDVFLNISQYVDALLERFYGVEKFYNAKTREDLIGHLILGLAPHTSAAIVGRIVGFSKSQGCLAHPMWHAAMRRDCEGDETCIMLLLETLINFSQRYLPAHRGGTQDAPLVASSKLEAAEIDDMAFDMDLCWEYPLELYEAAELRKEPWEIKIEQLASRLGTDKAYFNFGFTHNVKDFNDAIQCSAYKLLPSMPEKVAGQMWIAEKLRSVDKDDVARLVIERHFIRDTRGNLRKFSQQQFRCVACNSKYRRVPLVGKCTKCGGKLIFTISEGSIMKYMQPALELARKYHASAYLLESLELTEMYIQSIFGKEKEKQESIKNWF